MNDENLEHLMGETRIIRHWGKIKAVRENAAAMVRAIDDTGAFGAYLADWPARDIMGLWADLAKRFSQMGGNSGPYFLRMAGKDTFLLTGDVVRALVAAGVVAKKPTTKDARAATQAAFNAWAAETGPPALPAQPHPGPVGGVGGLYAAAGKRRPRSWGAAKSMTGPLGTMRVGFTVSWLP